MNETETKNVLILLALLHAKVDQLMEWTEPADWKERMNGEDRSQTIGERAAAYERGLFENWLVPPQK